MRLASGSSIGLFIVLGHDPIQLNRIMV
jgi:hypothetical protein